MKEIAGFIRVYAREVNKPVLIICTLFTGILIWLNYANGLEYRLVYDAGLPSPHIFAHFIIFQTAFWVPYSLLLLLGKKGNFLSPRFIICAIAAPLIFALKVGMDTTMQLSADEHWNRYWNDILYWPPRLLMVLIMLTG